VRIAVVGGGLFGCTAAIHLARERHDVVLYERAGVLMQAASGINQGRLHEGYHYPRSLETARQAQAGARSFVAEYGRAVIGHAGRQYYAIAREGSRVTPAGYGAFCRLAGLRGRALMGVQTSWLVDPAAVDCVLNVAEDRIDLARLRAIVVNRLEQARVEVRYEAATADLRAEYDRIVIAAYASTNEVAAELGAPTVPLQFEVVEKPILRLPERLRGLGVVIMDGPFCCIDPWGRTADGLHVMGHVEHAIHWRNVGLSPRVPPHLAPWLNRGLIAAAECAEHSRFGVMADDGRRFIPALAEAEHVGSMFTVRAVLPDRDHDDARPTMVEQIDEQVIRIFGGKLSCAVDAARRTVDMIRAGANQSERAAA
jgi:glycine/D-amino acid oxidase-like deaminating enzyme